MRQRPHRTVIGDYVSHAGNPLRVGDVAGTCDNVMALGV